MADKLQQLYDSAYRLIDKRKKDKDTLFELKNQIVSEALRSISDFVQQDSLSGQFIENSKQYRFEVKIDGESELLNSNSLASIVYDMKHMDVFKDDIRFDFYDIYYNEAKQTISGHICIGQIK